MGISMVFCSRSDAPGREPVAFFATVVLIWATGIFSAWTLVHTAATFGHIPWRTTTIIACVTLAGATLLAAPVAGRFWEAYVAGLDQDGAAPSFSPTTAMGIIAFAAGLYVLPGYTPRFCLAVAVFLFCSFMAFRSSSYKGQHAQPSGAAPRFEVLLFAALLCAALLFTLFAYKSDYDDSEYLQIAIQTLLHPERAPLTFDSSLGYIVEFFRFQPYRFSAYENFAAFLSDVSSANLLTVYYLLLPAVGSILCMCCAYLLARWFLSRRMALAALFIFLLVLIAWGETSIAYGSRVLVRLYQGKGWLVAVSTPFVILCGLMLMREKRPAVWLCYAAGNIAATGLSSSGLVVACGTALLLAPLALTRTLKKTAANLLILGSGVAYPLLCGLLLLLKFPGAGSVIAEYISIDASLGGDGRESLTLALFAFSACLWDTRRRRELFLLIVGILFLIMNPWTSEIIAAYSAPNMRWRLAWAAPIPILSAILFVSFWKDRGTRPLLSSPGKSSFFAGACIITLFLCIAPWVSRPGNGDFHFSFPTWKLPPEYAEIKQIAESLPGAADGTSVLIPFRQGAWLPVIRPELRVILPGHGYPLVLPRIMPAQEFQERVELQGVPENPHLEMLASDRLFYLLLKFNVRYIVAPKGSRTEEILHIVNGSSQFRARSVRSTDNFTILRITPKGQVLVPHA